MGVTGGVPRGGGASSVGVSGGPQGGGRRLRWECLGAPRVGGWHLLWECLGAPRVGGGVCGGSVWEHGAQPALASVTRWSASLSTAHLEWRGCRETTLPSRCPRVLDAPAEPHQVLLPLLLGPSLRLALPSPDCQSLPGCVYKRARTAVDSRPTCPAWVPWTVRLTIQRELQEGGGAPCLPRPRRPCCGCEVRG